MDVLVFAEQRDGRIKKVVFQALGLAGKLLDASGGCLSVVLIGSGIRECAEELLSYGVKTVYLADSERLEKYSSELYGSIVARLVADTNPNLVLFGATSMGKDLAPKAAARCRRSVISDVTSLEADSGDMVKALRPVYAGKAYCEVKSNSSGMQFVTIRQNMFSAASAGEASSGEVRELDLSSLPPVDTAAVKEVVVTDIKRVDLTEAEIIVSGGRGLKKPENFNIIEDLADALGATVGASRAAVDAGWRPHSFQVGLTGKTVSPLLYVACGISGAVQHQAGMSSSRYIVAINKDPDAPIFKIASYGIVGDLFEIVPLLAEEIRTLKEKD